MAQKLNPATNVPGLSMIKLLRYSSIDVSIAVALKEGLITPIIKNTN